MSNKPFVSQRIVSQKVFEYGKGDCNLKFTLSTETRSEMEDFKELLDKASSDLGTILAED